ncbi:MAG TPA: GHMP kinase [Anaerolineae bacterium]|nr:GHMP kinase [Anaerolineae bacterium]
MLIARAPVRISFGGGGTDLEAYYARFGGMVVSTTIDHYAYTILSPGNRDSLEINSADYSTFYRQPICEDLIWDGDLALPKAIIHHFGLKDGLNVFLASQIPPGTGLGSSGSVAVSMIKALSTWHGLHLSPGEVAELACHIEIEKMGMPVGKQDQYAASFGGLNFMVFTKEGVTVEPLRLPGATLETLQRRLMLFFLGGTRKSSSILKYQKRATEKDDERTVYTLHAIKELGLATKDALEKGDLKAFGELLDLSWQNKRTLAPNITNTFIDDCYAAAKAAGAEGGKLTGAGSGGFLMLYCREDYQDAVTKTLEGMGLRRMDFGFDFEGARIVLSDDRLDHARRGGYVGPHLPVCAS